MKKVIEAIRGVVGVSGVILWERSINEFHKLLPARIEPKVADELSSKLADFAAKYETDHKLIARFKNGWLFIYNHESFSILVIGKSDLNTTTLNLVLKSAVSSLGSTARIQRQQIAPLVKFTPQHAAALARAVNLSLGFFQGQLSRFEIAEMLRLAKSSLLHDYPALKHFTIDANGGVIIIKGAEKQMEGTSVMAAARLILVFIDLAKSKANVIGFEIEKLTSALQPALSELGFYNCFKESARVKVK